ncbi:hypothetical protein L2E82_16637 [Cichorium intybus]|uniref:Uncharacterized protein n=1 Tax=Cichorium intybus TaxID=13427 RepID=A0ACB9F6P4_CICIN|nr:hypothetical protein L2E82_16637 [Cichorium intybus]
MNCYASSFTWLSSPILLNGNGDGYPQLPNCRSTPKPRMRRKVAGCCCLRYEEDANKLLMKMKGGSWGYLKGKDASS